MLNRNGLVKRRKHRRLKAPGTDLRAAYYIRWTRNVARLGLANSRTADVAEVENGGVMFKLEDGSRPWQGSALRWYERRYGIKEGRGVKVIRETPVEALVQLPDNTENGKW